MLHDGPPSALVVGSASVALVDHDEVEEILRVLPEVGHGIALLVPPAHEGLEDGEEYAPVLRHSSLLADLVRCDPHQRILFKSGERIERLVRQDVAVGQEQDARAPVRFATQVPLALEKFPSQLKSDKGFSRPCG